jgi:hypothetical protein
VRKALVFGALLAAGCGDASPAPTGFQVRDSAGIRIAESVTPAWGPGEGWQLSAAPTLQIGLAYGPDELVWIQAARLLPDGGVVVADDDSEVRRFDAAGAQLWATKLEGAGFLSSVRGIYPLTGDSIGVFSTEPTRYTTLDSDGHVGRVLAIRAVPDVQGVPVGMLPDGSLVVWVNGNTTPPQPVARWRPSNTFLRVDLSDAHVDSIGAYPGQELFAITSGPTQVMRPPPFLLTRAETVRGSELILAYTERFELLVLDATGAVKQIVRRPYDSGPVTETAIQTWKQANTPPVGTEPRSESDELERLFAENMTYPASLAVLGGALLADPDGNLWVSHSGEPEDLGGWKWSGLWSVFDPEGRWLGEIQLPAGLHPLDITRDRILGVITDEFGTDYLRVYALARP